MTPGALDRTKLLPKSGIGVVPPWLIIAPPGNPVIRLDLRGLDSIRLGTEGDGDDVIVACGDLEISISVADGPEAIRTLVRDATPLTREACHDMSVSPEELLFVGADPVLERGDYIQIGCTAFRISEVADYAMHGANLPLTGGRLLQAAMAMLVVAAR